MHKVRLLALFLQYLSPGSTRHTLICGPSRSKESSFEELRLKARKVRLRVLKTIPGWAAAGPLDRVIRVIHTCLTMTTATVRDLRNHFRKIKEIVESQGEVIVTDKGQPKYRLTLFTAGQPRKTRRAKDYMARMQRHQLHPISAAAAKSLQDENRGKR